MQATPSRSPLGAFVRSPLGVRGGGGGFIRMFQGKTIVFNGKLVTIGMHYASHSYPNYSMGVESVMVSSNGKTWSSKYIFSPDEISATTVREYTSSLRPLFEVSGRLFTGRNNGYTTDETSYRQPPDAGVIYSDDSKKWELSAIKIYGAQYYDDLEFSYGNGLFCIARNMNDAADWFKSSDGTNWTSFSPVAYGLRESPDWPDRPDVTATYFHGISYVEQIGKFVGYCGDSGLWCVVSDDLVSWIPAPFSFYKPENLIGPYQYEVKFSETFNRSLSLSGISQVNVSDDGYQWRVVLSMPDPAPGYGAGEGGVWGWTEIENDMFFVGGKELWSRTLKSTDGGNTWSLILFTGMTEYAYESWEAAEQYYKNYKVFSIKWFKGMYIAHGDFPLDDGKRAYYATSDNLIDWEYIPAKNDMKYTWPEFDGGIIYS